MPHGGTEKHTCEGHHGKHGSRWDRKTRMGQHGSASMPHGGTGKHTCEGAVCECSFTHRLRLHMKMVEEHLFLLKHTNDLCYSQKLGTVFERN